MIVLSALTAAQSYGLLTLGLAGIAVVVALAPRRKSAATLAVWLAFTCMAGSGVLHVLEARGSDDGWGFGLLLAAAGLLALGAGLAIVEFRERDLAHRRLASDFESSRREVERLTGAAVRLEDELSETRRTLRKSDERTATASLATSSAFDRQKQAVEAAAQSVRKLRAVIDAAVDGVILLERESLRVAEYNPSALALCGRDEKSLRQTPFLDLLGGDGPKVGRADLLRAARERRPLSTTFGRPDGSSVAVEITVAAVGEGEDAKVLAIVRDESQRSTAERDWESSLETLREKVRAAEERARAAVERSGAIESENARLLEREARKDEYIGMVSHELRTPLTSIRSFSEILLKHGDTEPAIRQEFLGIIQKESERLTRMVNNVLDLARIEAGATKLSMSDFDAGAVAGDAVAALRGASTAAGVSVVFEGDRAPRPMRADRDRVQQLLMNLLSNALKFSPAGAQVSVRIAEGDQAGRVRFSVEDAGCGIAAEDLGRIFEKFQRVEGGPSSSEGTGLGLAICKEIAGMHGGRIWAESAPGKGSVFHAEFPGVEDVRRVQVGRPAARAKEPAPRGFRAVGSR